MPVESASDRAAFLNIDEFGASGVYTPAGGASGLPFPGIFDDPTISTEFNEAATIDSRPTFCCAANDLPPSADALEGTDLLDVAGHGIFRVVSIELDGQGMVLLRLGAVA